MVAMKPMDLAMQDTLTQNRVTLHQDAFGADESSVRWDLISRVRQAIEDGSYDEDSRIDALLDRLTTDLDL